MDTTDKPRLLMLLPYVPYPLDRGTYQRVYHLARELGHYFAIDLFCLSEGSDGASKQEHFMRFCERVEFVPFMHPPWAKLFPDRLLNSLPSTVLHWQCPAVAQRLLDFVAQREYELLSFCDLVLWPYVEALPLKPPTLVMDRSRVDWLFQQEELQLLPLSRKERLLRQENLFKIAQLERRVYQELALEVVCGLDDKTFLEHKLGDSERVEVLPNGYAEDYFDVQQWPRALTAEPSLLFCGALDYSPNVEGLRWFIDEIHPQIAAALPSYRLFIIGKSPTDEVLGWQARAQVEVIGEVPDVRPWYQQAWGQVVPLRIGGGTRLKIVESLAMQCPVISTTIGAQGLELYDEQHLLLADTPASMAKACLRLLQDAALREGLTEGGYQQVCTHYRWSQLGQRLASIYQQLTPLAS